MIITKEMLLHIAQIAYDAGQIILPYYHGEKDKGIEHKDDNSPLTLADQAAEDYIIKKLESAYPSTTIIAEEKAANGDIPDIDTEEYFFLVDPLDGTKEFINKRDEFTVNIALVHQKEPVLGAIYAPALDTLYFAAQNLGAWKCEHASNHIHSLLADAKEIHTSKASPPTKAVASRSHMSEETKKYLEENNIQEYISAGSSLKFCMIAEGRADMYPRFGRTMEWDTAAGDAIVRSAGGHVYSPSGEKLIYGKTRQSHDSDFANPFFIVKNISIVHTI